MIVEGDIVVHRDRCRKTTLGKVLAVYPRSRQADVLWPWSLGPDDAALMSLDEIIKFDPASHGCADTSWLERL